MVKGYTIVQGPHNTTIVMEQIYKYFVDLMDKDMLFRDSIMTLNEGCLAMLKRPRRISI
jgi:hypothetical protein